MKLLSFLTLLIPFLSFSQNDNLTQYQKVLTYTATEKPDSAYQLIKKLERHVLKSDSLYPFVLESKIIALMELEKEARRTANFEKSLEYGLETMQSFQLGKTFLKADILKNEYLMTKNLVVSYFGSGNIEQGLEWKEKLYRFHKAGLLPRGMQVYFNFDFFTVDDLNVYGYEWFDEYPTSPYDKSNFTKVVYYVYTQKRDGSDDQQLYRLALEKFNGTARNMDYVLTKKSGSGPTETSVTLYAYPFVRKIDYQKLQKEVREIAEGNIKNYFKDNRKL